MKKRILSYLLTTLLLLSALSVLTAIPSAAEAIDKELSNR